MEKLAFPVWAMQNADTTIMSAQLGINYAYFQVDASTAKIFSLEIGDVTGTSSLTFLT